MPKKKTKYVVANWKLNPLGVTEAKELAKKTAVAKATAVQTIICPPAIFLNEVGSILKKKKIVFGSQDVFWETKGAFTGNVNAEMVKNSGATYTIIGHSEKRALGDSNELVAKKGLAAIKAGLSIVLCVGEKERDTHGAYLAELKEQLEQSLKGINRKYAEKIIIAYEPIWAIGKAADEAMTAHDVHQMVIFVRKHLIPIMGANASTIIPILYGGSVDTENTTTLINEGEVDGLLVGHNSLDPQKFVAIVKAVGK